MKLTITTILSLLLIVSSVNTKAQSVRHADNNAILWIAPSIDIRFTKKWSWYIENQFRSVVDNPKFYQFQLRTAAQYRFNSDNILTVGYVYTWTDKYGDEPSKHKFLEHRSYIQFQNKQKLGRTEYFNRYRLEQRFQEQYAGNYSDHADTITLYKNRARYLTRFNIPITKKGFDKGGAFIAFYDELFIGFGKKVKYNMFDQNRTFVGIGYMLGKNARLEAGYFQQIQLHGDGKLIEYNKGVQVNFGYSLALFEKKKK